MRWPFDRTGRHWCSATLWHLRRVERLGREAHRRRDAQRHGGAVTFRVDAERADQTAIWQSGSVVDLDLSVDGGEGNRSGGDDSGDSPSADDATTGDSGDATSTEASDGRFTARSTGTATEGSDAATTGSSGSGSTDSRDSDATAGRDTAEGRRTLPTGRFLTGRRRFQVTKRRAKSTNRRIPGV